MTKNVMNLFAGLLLLAGLLASPVYADLGLSQTLADQGVQAVGTAVKEAAEAIYAAGGTNVQSQLTAILNEAEATGDEGAMRYAIVAVMLAGGAENLDLSRSAVNHSAIFANYPELTAFTVAAAESLIGAGGADEEGGGEDEQGGGEDEQGGGEDEQGGGEDEQGGGEDPESLGGGDPNPFDPGADGNVDDDSVAPYGRIRDRDSAATRI